MTARRGNRSDRDDRLFARLLVVGQLIAAAVLFATVAAGPSSLPLTAEDGPRTIQLRFETPPQRLEPEPVPTVAPDPAVVERNSVLPEEEAVPEPKEPAVPVEIEPEEEAVPPATPPRRVYGVRKILANGFGGDVATNGLVGKVGNVLNGRADSLVATAADLAGTLVSLSSVDAAPEPLRRVVPEYSDELRRQRASGTVAARLLIDLEGAVRRIEILSDFGFGSGDLARRAFAQFRFRPATRDGKPVSVWIVHKIRFEFQE